MFKNGGKYSWTNINYTAEILKYKMVIQKVVFVF